MLKSSNIIEQGQELECRQCGVTVAQENSTKPLFCPKCGTHLRPRIPPQHWLFQFNPSMYNWFEWIRNNNETEQWLTSQHFKYIREGDLVAIWASGQQAGIYATGQIIQDPKKMPLNPDQEKYYMSKNDVSKFREKPSTIVKYSPKTPLATPLLLEECRNDQILSEMQIFLNPQGTNFRLSTEQWNRISELLKAKMA